jgi:hypothetical protein
MEPTLAPPVNASIYLCYEPRGRFDDFKRNDDIP